MGCRARRPATELVRCARGEDGRVMLDRTAPGRGAWLCPEVSCLDAAIKRAGFDRAFRTKVPPEALAGLTEEFQHFAASLRSMTG